MSEADMSDGRNASDEGVERRLDAIINILLRQTRLQEESARDHIALLHSQGFSDIEIARILGRTRGYVSGERVKMRTAQKNE
jgi:hypothetical protein